MVRNSNKNQPQGVLHSFLYDPNIYMSVVLKIKRKGILSVEEIGDAILKAYTQNETTMSKVVLNNGEAYFENMPTTGCKVYFDNRDWLDIINESEKVALNLSFTGTIKDDILEITEIAYCLTKFLLENYKNKLIERYSLDEKIVDEILKQEQDENLNIYEIMQLIGKRRGAIISGGNIDDEKTSKIILDDFRTGKLGKITLEML